MFAHWGTFTKPNSLNVCLNFAGDSLRQHGYQIWETVDDGDYMVIGGRDNVIVNVTCVPQRGNTWVSVSAYSPDSGSAESARNSVRETIVRLQLIDEQ
ncbi:hypothetical protein [Nocardia blacklockiae]|uniref:hypothetical protein n=1 Tax=Nocardia blacklockiae TaxID=480036 RepID=UPI001894A632|nr:hypothetical protein [Nocardia blacklockiae]MBF6174079.1 hypothetical protein [Nocardia blacklockiae]